MGVDDLFYGGDTVSADQLVLQICDAHVEAQPLHFDACEVGAEGGSLETSSEVTLLARVAETRQPDPKTLGPELIQEPPYGLGTADRHDGDALGFEIPATPHGECLESALIADSLDEHDRARADSYDWRV